MPDKGCTDELLAARSVRHQTPDMPVTEWNLSNRATNETRSRCVAALVVFVLAMSPANVGAQGEITGRVLAADSGRPPVVGAEVSIARAQKRALTDSSGRFRLRDVPVGEHLVMLRAIGFAAESSKVMINPDESVSMELVLRRTTGTVLPERVVSAPESRPEPAKLAEFAERRATGVGHFLTREQLEKAEGGKRQTGDVISQIPGVRVRRGGNKIWVASARTPKVETCAFCPATIDTSASSSLNAADFSAGARPACYMDVYVDGVMVFDSRYPGNGLFDINTISPEHIAGIEVYSSALQVPAKYNRTGSSCGVVLIWTR